MSDGDPHRFPGLEGVEYCPVSVATKLFGDRWTLLIVRDAFLGRTSPDLDFTTDARPEQIEAILDAWAHTTWDVGRRFGTIGGRRGDLLVEVTTHRADAYDGVTRKPVVAFGERLEDDLVRRDFTVNAMALRLPSMPSTKKNQSRWPLSEPATPSIDCTYRPP